jgi:hypothetical protein
MKLIDYLLAIEDCKDKELREFGIGDNYPILLSSDISEGLLKSGRYHWEEPEKEGDPRVLAWNDGTIVAQFRQKLGSITFVLAAKFPNNKALQVHANFQRTHFSDVIYLYPYQKVKKRGISDHRMTERVIRDIANYAIINKVNVCFPRSTSGCEKMRYPSNIVYSDSLDYEVKELVRQQRQIRGKR